MRSESLKTLEVVGYLEVSLTPENIYAWQMSQDHTSYFSGFDVESTIDRYTLLTGDTLKLTVAIYNIEEVEKWVMIQGLKGWTNYKIRRQQ